MQKRNSAPVRAQSTNGCADPTTLKSWLAQHDCGAGRAVGGRKHNGNNPLDVFGPYLNRAFDESSA